MTFTGDAVIHSWIDGRKLINIYNMDGQSVETHPSPHICTDPHYSKKVKDKSGYMLTVNIDNTEHIVTSCDWCGIFILSRENNSYNYAFKNKGSKLHTYPGLLCKGPGKMLLAKAAYKPQNMVHVFDYSNSGSITFKRSITFPDKTESKYSGIVWYDHSVPGGLVIITYPDIHYIAAMSLETLQLVWRVQGEVAGKLCYPKDVTSDGQGKIYVADGPHGRVLILRARDGQVIQVIDLGLHFIYRLAWRPTQPHLMLFCVPKQGDDYHVSLYSTDSDSVSLSPVSGTTSV